MVISVECPACGKVLRVKDIHAGKKGKCPACGAVLQVPEPASRVREPVTRPSPSVPRRARFWIAGGVIGGVVLLALLVVMVVRRAERAAPESAGGVVGNLPAELHLAAEATFAEGKEFFLYDVEPNLVTLGEEGGTHEFSARFARSGHTQVPLDGLVLWCLLPPSPFAVSPGAGESLATLTVQGVDVEGGQSGVVRFYLTYDDGQAREIIRRGFRAKVWLAYGDPVGGGFVHCSNDVELPAKQ